MMTMYVSPYRRLASLRQAMDRLLDENLTETTTPEREMLLAVDVHSEDDAFVVRALVPGLETDDLNIEILNNTVSIRGEFKCQEEGRKYITCELPEGRFARVLTLPADVDAAKADASLKNGVLTLRVPKAESHRPKTIKVSSN